LSDQYFALIFAENFLDLVFAAYLALQGKRVGVVANKAQLQNSADALLLDPFRSRTVCDWLGLPLKSEKNSFTPDFQIISPKYRLELFWDRTRREFVLERDLGRDWKKFSALIDHLVELGDLFQGQIKEHKIVDFKFRSRILARFFSTVKPTFDKTSLSDLVNQYELGPEHKTLLMAPLKIISPFFRSSSPLFSGALLWKFLLSGAEGSAGEAESWEAIFEILSANGALIEEPAQALTSKGKKLLTLKLHSGREIAAEHFFGEPNRVFYLFEYEKRESRHAKSLMAQFARATFYTHVFRMNSSLWPEPMCERVLWAPAGETEPSAFLLISHQVTPKSIQVSLSYGLQKGEAKPLSNMEIFEGLRGLLPWLAAKDLESEAESLPAHQHLRFHASQIDYPAVSTAFSNLFLNPSELMPFFGFQGMFRLAEILMETDRKEKK
jgi:hypothetical protein